LDRAPRRRLTRCSKQKKFHSRPDILRQWRVCSIPPLGFGAIFPLGAPVGVVEDPAGHNLTGGQTFAAVLCAYLDFWRYFCDP